MNIPLSPCVPENLVSRDGFSRPVPRQPAHLHTQAESGAYLQDSSRVPRRRPLMNRTPSGQSQVFRVTQLRADGVDYRESAGTRPVNLKVVPNECCLGRSPWTIIFASLSHSHYWYEVGMLKVPAVCTFSIREDGDRKILRQDTKTCVWPTHKNQEKIPEIHTAFRICRLLAFTPNTMYVVVLYLQPMYVGVIFDQRRWRSKNTATRYQGVRMAHS